MDATQTKRVLVVDGEPPSRAGFVGFIRGLSGHEFCGEAATPERARELCAKLRPDLIVLDLPLPDGRGAALPREFAKLHPAARTIVVAAQDDVESVERFLRAGAHGFVRREDSFEELPEAFAWALRGDCFVSHRVSQELLRRAVRHGPSPRTGDAALLTERELEVFELLGRGFGPKAISETLHLSVKTVETYQQSIKQKLKARTAIEVRERARRWVEARRGARLPRQANEPARRRTQPSQPAPQERSGKVRGGRKSGDAEPLALGNR